jgi:hypothetical protein
MNVAYNLSVLDEIKQEKGNQFPARNIHNKLYMLYFFETNRE